MQIIIFITMLLFCFKVYASGLFPIGSIKQVWNNLNRMAEPDAVPVAGKSAVQLACHVLMRMPCSVHAAADLHACLASMWRGQYAALFMTPNDCHGCNRK